MWKRKNNMHRIQRYYSESKYILLFENTKIDFFLWRLLSVNFYVHASVQTDFQRIGVSHIHIREINECSQLRMFLGCVEFFFSTFPTLGIPIEQDQRDIHCQYSVKIDRILCECKHKILIHVDTPNRFLLITKLLSSIRL